MDNDRLNNAHDDAFMKTSSLRGVSKRVRSRRLAEKEKQSGGLNRCRSFRCEDFTAAIDLMSLSKERYRLIGKSLSKLQDRHKCLKSEVGVSDQDLMACSQALPIASAPDFKRIQSKLVTAQWEVQAAEIGTQTVAEILAECSEETARKRSKYWEARSQLESFIMKHFTQP